MTLRPTDLFDETTSDTGKVEISSFTDVDTALENRIGYVLDKLVVSNPEHRRNKALANFAARPIEEKIAAGEFAEASKFLLAFNRSQEKKKDKVQLPMVYITRNPSFSFVDKGRQNDTEAAYPMIKDDVQVGVFDVSTAVLYYQVNFVGWQQDDIDRLGLLLAMWVRHKSKEHAFTAKTMIAGIPYVLDISIEEREYASVDSSSAPFEEAKTRVMSVPLTVHAECVMARYTTTTKRQIIGEGVLQ